MTPRAKATTTEARDRLAELDGQIVEAQERLDSTHRQAAEALGSLNDLRIREQTAWTADDHAEAEKLAQERVRIEASKGTWQARLQAATHAVEAARAAHRSFVTNNCDLLVEEYVEDASQVTADFMASVEKVRERLTAFVRLEQTLRGYVAPDRHRQEDGRLVELAKLTEQLLDPEFQTAYSVEPLGPPDPMPKLAAGLTPTDESVAAEAVA